MANDQESAVATTKNLKGDRELALEVQIQGLRFSSDVLWPVATCQKPVLPFADRGCQRRTVVESRREWSRSFGDSSRVHPNAPKTGSTSRGRSKSTQRPMDLVELAKVLKSCPRALGWPLLCLARGMRSVVVGCEWQPLPSKEYLEIETGIIYGSSRHAGLGNGSTSLHSSSMPLQRTEGTEKLCQPGMPGKGRQALEPSARRSSSHALIDEIARQDGTNSMEAWRRMMMIAKLGV
ncbi:hypothetical protein IWX90DRAFT_44874 [Phyllosticta citrichinensis]|uniref:Uncharacterized protein n=1 Tax=Phyllosticta citrichinensis TaxID=1130410 RepID=A0ABR1Y925_9PEZI